MVGVFGSYVVTAEEGGVAVGTDLVDLIFEQESQRYPDFVNDRDKFKLVNFSLTAPQGTMLTLNGSDLCRVLITDTKQLVIPSNASVVTNCTFLADVGSVNCRYLY